MMPSCCKNAPLCDATGQAPPGTPKPLHERPAVPEGAWCTSLVRSDVPYMSSRQPPSGWKSSVKEGRRDVGLSDTGKRDSSDSPVARPSDEKKEAATSPSRPKVLPSTWYYSSNHILINRERIRRNLPPLVRWKELDDEARVHAKSMADRGAVEHSDASDVRKRVGGGPYRRIGENVARGTSVRAVHNTLMRSRADKNNMLDGRFAHMGMGTAKGPAGALYICQLFRG